MKENTNKEKCANCTYPELLPKAGLKKKKRKEKKKKKKKDRNNGKEIFTVPS